MSALAPMRWYKNAAFDAPHLNSPQPCSHGAGCDYRVKKDGVLVPGCCAFVHPGEEGTGRRFFEERITVVGDQIIVQKPCVRLVGKAGFYERRGRRIPWRDWCERNGIPYSPNPPREVAQPLQTQSSAVTYPPVDYICRNCQENELTQQYQLLGSSLVEAINFGTCL